MPSYTNKAINTNEMQKWRNAINPDSVSQITNLVNQKANQSDLNATNDNVNVLTSNLASNAKRLTNLTIDVKVDYGAKGDGVTNDTVAIQSALSYAATLVQLGLKPTIFFPQGVYIVSNGVLSGFTSSSIIAGITFKGINQYSSVLYLECGGVQSWFYDNGTNSKMENVLFEKLGFTSNDSTNGNGFKITSSGNEKQFDFHNCAFGNNINSRIGMDTSSGGLYGILDTEGTANADLMKFVNCKLYCNGFVVNNNNPQSVSIEFHACDGMLNGDFFRLGATPGGCMKVFGGAWDMYANPTNTASYLVNVGTASQGLGNGDISFFGIRLEIHGTNKGLVNAQNLTTGYTTVNFEGCNLAASIDNTQTMVIIATRKTVTFRDCILNEKILYQFVGTQSNSASAENSGLIVIENCQIGSSTATPLFNRFTTAGLGRVVARNNRTNGAKGLSATDVMDFDLGWQTSMSRDANVIKKIAVIINSAQGFPYSGSLLTWTVNLPVGAMVTRVYVDKPATGTGTLPNYQLYVGLGDKSVTWGSSTLQAQDLEHKIDVSPMYTIPSSGVTTVGVWADSTNSGSSGTQKGIAFIEYI